MTSPSRARHVRSIVASATVLASLLGCAACSSSHPKASSTPTPTPTSSTASTSSTTRSTPTPQKAAAPIRNPLTGIGGVPAHPVIAVKIDDTAPGRPQVGIDAADVVYIEAVEGGLTRLAAVFATNMPRKVGYVRSTRPSDPDLLLQYGKITEAYSGGAHDSLPRVRASGITSWSNDAGAPYYFRSPHAGDHGYINLALDLAKVAAKTRTNRAHSIGWTFSPGYGGLTTSRATDIRTTVTGSYSSGTAVEFRYDPKLRKYVRYIDGVRQYAADGKPIAATNVIVQSCTVASHPSDTDVNGNPSQFTTTVGGGPVAVFRQGVRINGVWLRGKLQWGTALRTGTGAGSKAIPLDPGNTWVVLIRKGVAVRG